jgi:hypothetical protein
MCVYTAGLAGRRGAPSLSIMVSFDGPLDQHFMRHPDELFQRPIECAQVAIFCLIDICMFFAHIKVQHCTSSLTFVLGRLTFAFWCVVHAV